MSVDAQTREQAVTNAVREISHIATLPEVTVRIVELVEDPNSTAHDLHKVIANDPALCSRVLKVVNSAFYGLPGQIGSINRAIVLLGLNAVKNIAIAASLAKLFRGGDLAPGFSAKELWTHSIAVATASKMLAEKKGMGLTDEAFLGGLIHDIGMMVEIQYDRQKLIEVIEKVIPDAGRVPAANMLEIEEQVFGANHQDFGQKLCERWKFPKSLINVTGFHHTPEALPADSQRLPAIIAVADRLAGEAEKGYRLDLMSTEVSAELLDMISLTIEQLTAVREKLPEQIAQAEQMLMG